MTNPAASVPLCPLTRTIRVDATLTPSRSRVAINKTEGNAENSSGCLVFIAIISIINPTMMLTVKRTSNRRVGSGNINNAMINRTTSGIAILLTCADEIDCRKSDSIPIKITLQNSVSYGLFYLSFARPIK